MVKKAKKEHFQNVNLSELTDNKKFWKTASPLFGNKVTTNHKINLRWLVGLKLIQLEQQKIQLLLIILAKNLKPIPCRVIKGT